MLTSNFGVRAPSGWPANTCCSHEPCGRGSPSLSLSLPPSLSSPPLPLSPALPLFRPPSPSPFPPSPPPSFLLLSPCPSALSLPPPSLPRSHPLSVYVRASLRTGHATCPRRRRDGATHAEAGGRRGQGRPGPSRAKASINEGRPSGANKPNAPTKHRTRLRTPLENEAKGAGSDVAFYYCARKTDKLAA